MEKGCEGEGDGIWEKMNKGHAAFTFLLVMLRCSLLILLFSLPASLGVRFRQQHFFTSLLVLGWMDGWMDGRTAYSLAPY